MPAPTTRVADATKKPSNRVLLEVAREELTRRQIAERLEAWCIHALAPLGQTPAPHHQRIIRELEAISRGDIDRLLITMPPGHAKSQYASILFPIWWMLQHPNTSVVAASYGSDLAEQFSGRIRVLVEEHEHLLGFGLLKGSNSREMWQTTNGCTYRAVGAGGAITGVRADVLIGDDFVKGRAEAESETARAKLYDWYRSDFYTRLKPGGRIVAIGTRWAEEDLLGRLIEGDGEPWNVIKLPAIANDPLDAMGRGLGEALWPTWMPVDKLERIRAVLGERDFEALYQCNPMGAAGALFQTDRLTVADHLPPGGSLVRGWDVAATQNGDWTCGVKLQRTPEGSYIVLDVVRFRGGPDDVERRIVQTAQQDGITCRQSLPIDPGAAGLSANMYLTRALAGYRVDSTRESGSKETRATPVASQVNSGNVRLVPASWNESFRTELASFPAGRHDDQVDALSRAFGLLMVPPRPAEMCRFNLMGR